MPLSVTPAAASQVVITSQPPANATAGAPFGLTAAIEDSFGNVVTSFNGSLTVGLASDPTGDVLNGSLTVKATGGAAIFSGLYLTQAGSGYTLHLSGSGLTSATTSALKVSPAKASLLVVTAEPPASVMAGAAFGMTVTAYDAFGNLATGFSGTVIASLSSGPAGTVLSGTTSLPAINGVATFSGLKLTRAAGAYALLVSKSGLTSATTTAIQVSPAQASLVVVTSEPPAKVIAGDSFGVIATACDAFGNVATSFNGSVNVSVASGPGGSVSGGTMSLVASAGVARFVGLSLTQAGSYSLRLSSTGLTSATTTSTQVSPATAMQLAVSSQPSASIIAGDAFGLTVTAYDTFGNLATGFNGSVRASLSTGPTGGTLGGITSISASSGKAVFTGLVLSNASGDYTLRLSNPGLTSATSNTVNVLPADSVLVITSKPPASVVAGGRVHDHGFGARLSWQLAKQFQRDHQCDRGRRPTGGVLSGATSVTATGGVATFTGLALTMAGNDYTLSIRSSGLTSTSAITVSVTPAEASQLVLDFSAPCRRACRFRIWAERRDRGSLRQQGYRLERRRERGHGEKSDERDTERTPVRQPVRGVATFSGLILATAGADYTFQISSLGLTPVTTPP